MTTGTAIRMKRIVKKAFMSYLPYSVSKDPRVILLSMVAIPDNAF
jgi:hypothetical protein